MIRRPSAPQESGQVIVFVVILLAMAAGAFWYANSARTEKEKSALAFASDISNRIILQGDTRALDLALSPEAKVKYPPSFRERMFDLIRSQGKPLSAVRVTGDVQFAHHFLDPEGHFRGEVDFADGPAYLQMRISHPGVLWQIDYMNWIWQRPPEPPPLLAAPSPTPTPTPSPASSSPPAKRKR